MSGSHPVTSQQIQEESLTGALGTAYLLLMAKIFFEKSVLASSKDYPKDYGPELQNRQSIFDIIIVGAGPAGVVLANRLSEIENWSVLLLEAGSIPSATTQVPAFYNSARGTNEDWNFNTQQEKNVCQGNKDKRCRISRGRAIGGTSSINNMHYKRALPDDFARWPGEEKHGWKMDQINENYRRHESHVHDDPFYKEDGPEIGEMTLNKLNGKSDMKDIIYEAAEIMGYEKMKPGDTLGYTDVLATIENGARLNFARAFLRPVKDRPNLAVARNAFVTKVLTQIPQDHRIQGVEVNIGGKTIQVKAKKEVILTAGAINTAQLLMLSGFGPKEHLQKVNVPALFDLPVGRNFQDQVSMLMFVGIGKEHCDKDLGTFRADEMYSYMMHRSGNYTHTGINDIMGFINTQKEDTSFVPNIMIYHYYFPMNDDNLKGIMENVGLAEPIVTSIMKYNKKECLVLFLPTLIKPKSRGEILLQNGNPLKPPLIMGNYFSDPGNEDFQTLLSGAKYILSMIETEPFKTRGAHFLNVDMPNCRNFVYCNEPYLSCALKNMAIPRSQVIGTAMIGNIHSETRVTDEFLLVDGIRHLRIVDGSVIPEQITANLEATVAMMAENAAQQIKKYWLNI